MPCEARGKACPQIEDEGQILQVWRVTANKQLRAAYKGSSPALWGWAGV